MTDVIFWCGPVVVTKEFQAINWYGRDVRIVPVEGHGSTHFSTLAESLRGPDGRILPGLIRRFGPRNVPEPEKIVLGAYSAGWGLLEKVARVDADRKRISAYMLSDAVFGSGKPGYAKFAADAARGRRLMVATTAHTTPGHYPSGRESWEMVWQAAQQATGRRPRAVRPPPIVPPASGGWSKLGSACYWGDYTKPGSERNQGNDFTHEQHHYLAPEVWQAYLAPWLAGLGIPWMYLLGGAAAGVAAGVAAHSLKG